MTLYIALLRAVNVGGTGKLPMADLKKLCDEAGCINVRTYIASGNVVFEHKLRSNKVKALLEAKLNSYAGKEVGVIIRDAAEMEAVLANNPFPHAAPNRTVAIFLDDSPPTDTLQKMTGCKNEEIVFGLREIYVHYGDGMADSKLRIPAAKSGTARNINTITKLVEMARDT
jgi:uncharacterized protein (DUF1697 family)